MNPFRSIGPEPAGENRGYIHRYDYEEHGFEDPFVRVPGAAAMVVILDPEFPANLIGQIAEGVAGQRAPIPIVGITHDAGTRMFLQANRQPHHARLATDRSISSSRIPSGADRVSR